VTESMGAYYTCELEFCLETGHKIGLHIIYIYIYIYMSVLYSKFFHIVEACPGVGCADDEYRFVTTAAKVERQSHGNSPDHDKLDSAG